MPSVFSDEVGVQDILLLNASHWTNGANLPNSDPSYKKSGGASDAYYPDCDGLVHTGDGTTSYGFWCRRTGNLDITAGNRVLEISDGGRGNVVLDITMHSTTEIAVHNSGMVFGARPATLNLNQWHFIECVFIKSGTYGAGDIYRDGVYQDGQGVSGGGTIAGTPGLQRLWLLPGTAQPNFEMGKLHCLGGRRLTNPEVTQLIIAMTAV